MSVSTNVVETENDEESDEFPDVPDEFPDAPDEFPDAPDSPPQFDSA